MLTFCSILKCYYGLLLLLYLCISFLSPVDSSRSSTRLLRPRCTLPEIRPHYLYAARRNNLILRVFCSKGYTLQGQRALTCANGKWLGEKPVCAKSGCLKPDDPEFGEVIINHGLKATLFCADSHKLAGNRYSYCNGTHWDRPMGNCRERSTNIQHECDFETEDLCGWVFEQSDDNEWKRTMAANIFTSFHTGPQHDHTTMSASGGHYMLMESYGNRPEPIALTSPIYERALSLKTACCFRFYYFMYGTGVGNLYVFVKPISISQADMLAKKEDYMKFNKTGNQNNLWNEAHFSIDEMHENFQIVFVATGGRVHLSDIAVDDVKLMTGAECLALDKHEEESNESAEIEERATEAAYFDTQTCVARCSQKSEQRVVIILNGTRQIMGLCSCHDECAEEDNCCPDYRSVCVNELFSESTLVDTYTTANDWTDLSPTTTYTTVNASASSKAATTTTTTTTTTSTTTTTTTTTTRKPTTTTTTTPQPTTTTTTPKPTTTTSTTTTTTTTTTTPKPTTTTTTTPKTTPRTTPRTTTRTTPKTTTPRRKTASSTTTTTTTPMPTTTTATSTTTTATTPTRLIDIIVTRIPAIISQDNTTWIWKAESVDNSNSPEQIKNNGGIIAMICFMVVIAILIILGAFSYRYKIPIANFLKAYSGVGRGDEESTSIVANFSQKKNRNGTADETSTSTISLASSVDRKVKKIKPKSQQQPTSKSKTTSSNYAREHNAENETFNYYNDRDDMALL